MEDEDEVVEEPAFTSKSIHHFKKRLGCMGDIYINDAPLASLSSSNTINEIKCPKKVMGMKMTEDLRSIAQFFMKPFPPNIDSIYYKMPDRSMEYF
jgi:3-phosphoglycerate kinase